MRRMLLLAVVMLVGCGGDDGPSDPGNGNNPPPPPPDPTLSSVTCTLDAISDIEYEGATRPSVAFAWSGHGVMSDATETALDSAVVRVGAVRVQKFTGGTSGSGTLGSGDTADGDNTLSATCYRDTRTGADSEGFRMSRIVNLPTIDLTSIVLDMDEDGSAEADLSGIVADGTLSDVQVNSGPVSIEVRNDSVFATPTADANGSFTLQFTATNDDGDANETGSWTIQPVTDFLAGQLQDSETDTGASGELRIYGGGQLLETISTNGSGNWSRTNLPDASQYRIEAELDAGSYIRTVRVSPTSVGADVDVSLIRAVPFTGLSGAGISAAQFKQFMEELLFIPSQNAVVFRRFDIETFDKACYLTANPEPTRGGTFSGQEIQTIENSWNDQSDIGKLLDARIFPIGECSDSDYSLVGGIIKTNRHILMYIPDASFQGTGKDASGSPWDHDFDGINESATIRILPGIVSVEFKKAVSHEPGHAFHSWNHPVSLSASKTIMRVPVVPTTPQFADEKAAAVMLDTTFKNGEDLNDILGL